MGHTEGRTKYTLSPSTHAHLIFPSAPQLLPFPIPITQQLSWNFIPCSIQPGSGAGRHLQHFLPCGMRGPRGPAEGGEQGGGSAWAPRGTGELGRGCKSSAMWETALWKSQAATSQSSAPCAVQKTSRMLKTSPERGNLGLHALCLLPPHCEGVGERLSTGTASFSPWTAFPLIFPWVLPKSATLGHWMKICA